MRPRVAALVLCVVFAAGACEPGVPVGTEDDTPPRFSITFGGLPAQGNDTMPPSPNVVSFVNALPSSQKANLGETYSVTAKLEDPESGITFLEMNEDKVFAGCWTPGPSAGPKKTLQPVVSGRAQRSPPFVTASTQPGETTTIPTTLPTSRTLLLDVDTNVLGGCAAGDELRWEIIIYFDGTNGAGQEPKMIASTPADRYWGSTRLRILRPF